MIVQIWDALSNEKAVQIIATAPTRATAAQSLVEYAVEGWSLENPFNTVDDCAVVCLYLDRPGDEETSTAMSSELIDNESPPSSPLTRPRTRPREEITLSAPCLKRMTPMRSEK